MVFKQVVQRVEAVEVKPVPTPTTTSTTPRPPYVYTYDKSKVINEILSVSINISDVHLKCAHEYLNSLNPNGELSEKSGPYNLVLWSTLDTNNFLNASNSVVCKLMVSTDCVHVILGFRYT